MELALTSLVWLGALFWGDAALKPELVELKVALDGPRVEVSFELEQALDAELIETVESGLPSGFTFDLRLYKDRRRWFDNHIRRTRLRVDAMYHAVTREYLINFKQDDKLIESRVVRDPTELEAALTSVKDFHAFTLDESLAGQRLILRARAEMGSKTILYFIPSKATTPWLRSRKFRLPNE